MTLEGIVEHHGRICLTIMNIYIIVKDMDYI